MNKALLFKEWIKTRWMFLLMFVVFILAMGLHCTSHFKCRP